MSVTWPYPFFDVYSVCLQQQVMAAPCAPKVKAILDRNQVDAKVQEWMVKAECNTQTAFANWLDDKKDAKAKIMDHIPEMKDNEGQLARLKQAWHEADAAVTRAIKRSADNLPPEEMDEFEELIDIDRVEGRVKASSVKKVGEIVEKHPEEALSIIRNWMYQEG